MLANSHRPSLRKSAWAMTLSARSQRGAPGAPAGQVAQRVDVHEIERVERAGGGRGADAGGVEPGDADRLEPGRGVRQDADLAQAAAVRADRQLEHPGAVMAGRDDAPRDVQQRARRMLAARAVRQPLAVDDDDVLAR